MPRRRSEPGERGHTLASLAEAGLFALSPQIDAMRMSIEQFARWVRGRYGDTHAGTIRAAWSRIGDSHIAAIDANHGGIPGLETDVPTDASVRGRDTYRYQVRIDLLDPDETRRGTNRDRSFSEYHTFNLSSRQTATEMMRWLPGNFRMQLNTREQRSQRGSPLPSGWREYSLNVEVLNIYRGQ